MRGSRVARRRRCDRRRLGRPARRERRRRRRVHDPDPEAERRVREVLENAERAWTQLTLAPRTPRRGHLRRLARGGGAGRRLRAGERARGRGAQAAPARGDRRARAAGRARRARRRRACCRPACRPTWRTPSGSSSAIRSTPSTCCRSSRSWRASERLRTTVERAAAFYRSLGMKPLRVRREIDGFVADRLLEALWREALWLVARRRRDGRGDRRRDPLRRRACAGRRWARS